MQYYFFLLLSVFCNVAPFQLSGVMSGNRLAGVPLGLSFSNGEPDVEGICTRSGVTCQNCTHSVTCVMLPIGWLKVPLEACADGMSCNGKLGGCSKTAVPECEVVSQKYQHTCEQVGIFPDAHDCRKFHLCSPPEAIPEGRPADHREALCPRHYGYNPQNAQCSVKLEYGQCNKKPVPDCTQVGQTGALPDSPNHYFVCIPKYGSLHPQIFICPHGWYFWGGFCRPEYPIISSTEASTTTVNKSPEIQSTTVEPTTSKIEGFFSTDKPVTYAPDTFLADRFPNLANYDDFNNDATTSCDEYSENQYDC